MNSMNKAYLLAIINAIIIGFSFLSLKTALFVTGPLDVLMYRFVFSFVIIGIPILLRWIPLNYRKKNLKNIILMSFLAPVLSLCLQAFGLIYATSFEAGILFALTPILTMIMGVLFLGERVNILQILFICSSVSGVIFIFVMKDIVEVGFNISSYTGIILLFLSVLSFSGYNVLSRFLSKEFTPFELSFGMMASGSVFFTIVSVTQHALNGTMKDIFLPLGDMKFLVSILYLSLFCSLLTSIITNYCLSKLEASRFSVFSSISTIVAVIAGVLFLDEKIYYYHIVGTILVIAGVIGVNRKRTK